MVWMTQEANKSPGFPYKLLELAESLWHTLNCSIYLFDHHTTNLSNE